MTTPLLDPKVDEETERDHACTARQRMTGVRCTEPAKWKAVFACCGYVKILCNDHVTSVMGGVCAVTCAGCLEFYVNVNPFLSVERL